jgi:hypothetical protein
MAKIALMILFAIGIYIISTSSYGIYYINENNIASSNSTEYIFLILNIIFGIFILFLTGYVHKERL